MTASVPVAIIGSINADVTAYAQVSPKPGETILGTSFALGLGGKGANQAVAVARAGGQSVMVGCIGQDAFGEVVARELEEAGVDTRFTTQVEDSTGIAHIRVDEAGENSIIVVMGANTSLAPDAIDTALAELPAGIVLTQLEITEEVSTHSITRAAAAGWRVVLDPAPARAIPEHLWASIDIVTPNEHEASIYSGIEVHDTATAIQAGAWFLQRGVRSALITLADAGAVLVDSEGTTEFAAHAVHAVDTTAAGDTFAGYLGAALARGASIRDAVTIAMAGGALAVTKAGASSSIPFAADVDAFLASAGSPVQ
ncbi:ribokinase [Humidisolicoccus flavus]|uniref:ribokinase n=1 Tax=Humidisolicoccus flavus TaxID=3111414 RepID=UPI003252EE5C